MLVRDAPPQFGAPHTTGFTGDVQRPDDRPAQLGAYRQPGHPVNGAQCLDVLEASAVPRVARGDEHPAPGGRVTGEIGKILQVSEGRQIAGADGDVEAGIGAQPLADGGGQQPRPSYSDSLVSHAPPRH